MQIKTVLVAQPCNSDRAIFIMYIANRIHEQLLSIRVLNIDDGYHRLLFRWLRLSDRSP